MEYYSAMLALGVPNIEMHLYGNGRSVGRDAGLPVLDLDGEFNDWVAAQDDSPLPPGALGYRIP